MMSVAKKSVDKISVGGRKFALRRLSGGVDEAEVIGVGERPVADHDDRDLLVCLVKGGEIVGEEPLEAARARHSRSRAELPMEALKMSRGDPVIDTVWVNSPSGSRVNPYSSSEAARTPEGQGSAVEGGPGE